MATDDRFYQNKVNVDSESNVIEVRATAYPATAILSGHGVPPSDIGRPNDFYINLSTGDLYGPKTNLGWGTPLPLVGGGGVEVGPTGPTGPSGSVGPSGPTGPMGETQGVNLIYSLTSSGTGLTSGQFGFNGSATSFFVSDTDASSNNITSYLNTLSTGDTVFFSGNNVSLLGTITSDAVDGSGYQTWDFTLLTLTGTFINGTNYSMLISHIGPSGPAGIDGPSGPTGSVGPTGTRIFHGTGAPSSGYSEGDYFLDENFGVLYIVQSGTWQFYITLKGDVGNVGPTGVTGPTGIGGDWSSAETIVSISTTTHTPSATHIGKLVTLTNSSPITVTLPPTSGVGTNGQRVDYGQFGAGQVTFIEGAGVTIIYTPTKKMRAQASGATAIIVDVNTWWLVGDLAVS